MLALMRIARMPVILLVVFLLLGSAGMAFGYAATPAQGSGLEASPALVCRTAYVWITSWPPRDSRRAVQWRPNYRWRLAG